MSETVIYVERFYDAYRVYSEKGVRETEFCPDEFDTIFDIDSCDDDYGEAKLKITAEPPRPNHSILDANMMVVDNGCRCCTKLQPINRLKPYGDYVTIGRPPFVRANGEDLKEGACIKVGYYIVTLEEIERFPWE